MSIGLGHKQLELAEAKASYARWGTMVLRFCELFIGEHNLAEQATEETFVRFLKGGHRAEKSGVPVALLGCAFRVACESPTRNSEPSEPLRVAIVHLDATSRAVFILHGVMSVPMPWVAAILGVPPQEATQLWAKALVEVRERLPQDFFKERRR